ncbi:response regulator transcription factor [Myxococcota bacterium]|nr:response regulator transcription factor [Myxococcota bacterium]
MIRIALVDDHPLMRHGVRSLLEAEPDMQVVGEFGDGLEAMRGLPALDPDVAVVDVVLPGMGGLALAKEITAHLPRCRTLMLSMHAKEDYVLEAIRNGAAGYVLKDQSTGELVRAVRSVVAGRRYLSPEFTDRAIDAWSRRDGPADVYESLTAREREVLQLAAEGHSNQEIGRRLFISPRTVEIHRANLHKKLELEGQTALVRYAIRRGLLPP